MIGIDKITARIEAEAAADAARIEEDARAQSETIRAEGETKAQERYWEKVREGVKAAEDRAQRLSKAANMEARKSILSSKQEIVENVFRLAEEKLRALSGDAYVDFLAGQAARAAANGRGQIVLTAQDKKTCGSKVLSRANARLAAEGKNACLTISDEEGGFSGGLILRDGDISVNCTIEALMAQAREDMAAEAAAELFA